MEITLEDMRKRCPSWAHMRTPLCHLAAAIAVAWCCFIPVAHGDSESIEVNARVLADEPESIAAVSDPKNMQVQLQDNMKNVYVEAGLPPSKVEVVSLDGMIQDAVIIPLTPWATTTTIPSTPQTTSMPPAIHPVAGDSDNSPVIVTSLVIGVVGLLGVAAWSLLHSRDKPQRKCTPNVLPVRVDPPQPESCQPHPQPAYYTPNPQPVYCSPNPQQTPPSQPAHSQQLPQTPYNPPEKYHPPPQYQPPLPQFQPQTPRYQPPPPQYPPSPQPRYQPPPPQYHPSPQPRYQPPPPQYNPSPQPLYQPPPQQYQPQYQPPPPPLYQPQQPSQYQPQYQPPPPPLYQPQQPSQYQQQRSTQQQPPYQEQRSTQQQPQYQKQRSSQQQPPYQEHRSSQQQLQQPSQFQSMPVYVRASAPNTSFGNIQPPPLNHLLPTSAVSFKNNSLEQPVMMVPPPNDVLRPAGTQRQRKIVLVPGSLSG